MLSNPVDRGPIQSLLALLDQSLRQLLRRRQLSRSPLAFRTSSAFALRSRLLWRSLVDADNTVPPASRHAAFAKEACAEHPEAETDESQGQRATPAHVGAEDEVGEDHDAEQQPEVSEDGLHGSKWVLLSLRTDLLGLVDLTGGLQSGCDCRVSRCTCCLGLLAISLTSIACRSRSSLSRRSTRASDAAQTSTHVYTRLRRKAACIRAMLRREEKSLRTLRGREEVAGRV